MRPVNQPPLSEMAMKRSPFASSRRPDNPPKPRKGEVSTSPLRNSSSPKRTRERSRVSKPASGRAFTSIETGSVTEFSSVFARFGGGCTAVCAHARSGNTCATNPAAAACSKPRRLRREIMRSGMQAPPATTGRLRGVGLAEQLGELFGDGAAEFLGIDDGHRAAIVARDVVADADRDQFDRRAGLDLFDDVTQMAFEIIARVDRQRGIVDRRAVRDHHQHTPLLGTSQQALVRPVQRLAVDVLLEQALAHHQAKILPRTAPGGIGGFVDDMAEIIEPARVRRLAGGKPGLSRLPALPGPRGEAEDFYLDPAALQRARENVGAGRSDRNGAAAH